MMDVAKTPKTPKTSKTPRFLVMQVDPTTSAGITQKLDQALNFIHKRNFCILLQCWEQMAAELDTGDRLQGRHCWTASGLIELHRHRPYRFEHLIFRSFQWGSTYFYLFVELWQPSGTRETTWHHPQRFPCFKAARKRCKGSKTPIPRWLKTQCYEIEVESIDPYRSF